LAEPEASRTGDPPRQACRQAATLFAIDAAVQYSVNRSFAAPELHTTESTGGMCCRFPAGHHACLLTRVREARDLKMRTVSASAWLP